MGEYYKHFNSSNFTTIKGKFELQNINKAEEQKLKIDKKTINGEQVKSIEEVIIANYLYLNGVKYIYEYQYPYDIEDNYRKIYRPDFYLPDYDVYIEHFGVNRDYKAPWLSEIEEQKYVEGIHWKRELHKENNILLSFKYGIFICFAFNNKSSKFFNVYPLDLNNPINVAINFLNSLKYLSSSFFIIVLYIASQSTDLNSIPNLLNFCSNSLNNLPSEL